MALDVDTTLPFRTPTQLQAFVEAIVAADPETTQEMHWVEWKRPLDLAKPEGQFHIAKAILAFANREPSRAAAVCEGTAYMVLGAMPGSAPGVTTIDHADLGQGVGKYVEGPLWSAADVALPGGRVALVITVEAPRDGHHIYPLLKQYDRYHRGMVFHRGAAQSEPAGPREIRMLEQRFANSALDPQVEVRVRVKAGKIKRLNVTREAEEAWIDERRAYIEAQVARPDKPAEPRSQDRAPWEVSPIVSDMFKLWSNPKERAQFDERVDEHVAECRDRLLSNVVRRIAESKKNKLMFGVKNPTGNSIAKAQLVVTVRNAEALMVIGCVDEIMAMPTLPAWPNSIEDTFAQQNHQFRYGVEVLMANPRSRWDASIASRGETLQLTFEVGDLRADETYHTPPVTVIPGPNAPNVLELALLVRATNRRGTQTVDQEIAVSDDRWELGDWVPASR